MSDNLNLFFAHHWMAVLISYALFSNFVSAMPSPNGEGALASVWYRWAFNFLHLCANNAARVAATMGNKLLNPSDKETK